MTIRSRFRALDTISVEGKTVLVRGDLNLPLKEGRVLDDTRLKNLASTLARLSQGVTRALVSICLTFKRALTLHNQHVL